MTWKGDEYISCYLPETNSIDNLLLEYFARRACFNFSKICNLVRAMHVVFLNQTFIKTQVA